MNPMARLKLLTELAGIRKTLAGLGTGPAAAMQRLKLLGRVNQIRKELGANLSTKNDETEQRTPDSEKGNLPENPGELGAVPPESVPAADATGQQTAFLQAVAEGEYDGEDLAVLLGKIEVAVNGLNSAGQLEGDAGRAANAAITRWAELDRQAYGD